MAGITCSARVWVGLDDWTRCVDVRVYELFTDCSASGVYISAVNGGNYRHGHQSFKDTCSSPGPGLATHPGRTDSSSLGMQSVGDVQPQKEVNFREKF